MTVHSALHAPDLPQLGGPVTSSTAVGAEPSSLCSLASSSARLKNASVSDSIWSGQTQERRASVEILYVDRDLESCLTEWKRVLHDVNLPHGRSWRQTCRLARHGRGPVMRVRLLRQRGTV